MNQWNLEKRAEARRRIHRGAFTVGAQLELLDTLEAAQVKVAQLRYALRMVKDSPDGSWTDTEFDHSYYDCDQCAGKNAIATVALEGSDPE